MSTSPLSTRTPSGLNLCRRCSCCLGLWVQQCISPVVSRTHWFLGVILSLLLRIFLPPLLHSSLNPGCGVGEGIPFKTGCSKISHFLWIVQLEVSGLLPKIDDSKEIGSSRQNRTDAHMNLHMAASTGTTQGSSQMESHWWTGKVGTGSHLQPRIYFQLASAYKEKLVFFFQMESYSVY